MCFGLEKINQYTCTSYVGSRLFLELLYRLLYIAVVHNKLVCPFSYTGGDDQYLSIGVMKVLPPAEVRFPAWPHFSEVTKPGKTPSNSRSLAVLIPTKCGLTIFALLKEPHDGGRGDRTDSISLPAILFVTYSMDIRATPTFSQGWHMSMRDVICCYESWCEYMQCGLESGGQRRLRFKIQKAPFLETRNRLTDPVLITPHHYFHTWYLRYTPPPVR